MNTSVVFHLLLNLPWPARLEAGSEENFLDGQYGDCRGIFGCFPTGPPWQGRDRVISLPPLTIDQIRPSFCLFTPKSPSCHALDVFDSSSIDAADISTYTDLVVITHGYMHSGSMPWLLQLADALLDENRNDATFATIVVDWQDGAHPPYAQAVANIRLLGAVTGRIIHLLMDRKGVKASQIHLVGHSLGSHMFGYSGSYIRKFARGTKVGRITGLDPAGPYFREGPPEVRLDKEDAQLVVAIHTDSTSLIPTLPESLGIAHAIGHVDFFPDGGGEQSRCRDVSQGGLLKLKDVSKTIFNTVSCSHMKSCEYFTASTSKKCNFIGIECPSWLDFQQGRCWDCTKTPCYKMGYYLERFYPPGHSIASSPVNSNSFNNRTKLYLTTASSDKLCGSQVRITIVPLNPKEAATPKSQFVRVLLTLRGNKATALTSPTERVIELGPGSPKTWVDAVDDIGKIHSIVFNHVVEEGFIQSIFWSRASKPLYLKEIIYEELVTAKRIVFYFCQPYLISEEVIILKNKPCKAQRLKRLSKKNYI